MLREDADDDEPPHMIFLDLDEPRLLVFDDEAAWRRWLDWNRNYEDQEPEQGTPPAAGVRH